MVETARRENPTLRIAGLRILESRALLGIAGSNRYPQLQPGQRRGRPRGAAAERRNAAQDLSFDSYQAGFDMGWELDFWGRFRRGIESANAAYFASITSQQDVQVLLSAQVADLYFGYRTTLLRIDIAERNAAIQKRSLEITEKDIQGRPGLGAGRAAGQDPIPRDAVDDSGPPGDAREAAQRARRPARPQARRGAGTGVRRRAAAGRGAAGRPGNSGRAAASPAGHPHGRLAGRRAVGTDRRREVRLLPGHHAARQHRLERAIPWRTARTRAVSSSVPR